MQKEETGYGWSSIVEEGLVEYVDTEVWSIERSAMVQCIVLVLLVS